MTSGEEFAQWISLLCEDEAFDAEVDRLGKEAVAELRRIYAEDGLLFGDDLRRRLLALRFAHAGRALRLVLSDFPHAVDWHIAPTVSMGEPARGGVVVHGWEVFGIGFQDTLVEIAAGIQADYIDEFWRVWPLCSGHRLGLKPDMRNGVGVWMCGSGPHEVARIGKTEGSRRR
ncbi:hypothetical protein F5972_32790 [Microbispora cellulosiformans]|uniref:Uncharacterized protein n=1 Tax=Microbispora cellulosiformans TaxID=2614688 RepID=A0A5J5JUU4_9ACTN|nr:hypothetical protein [Microbispora cellulosiformans]KAA9374018.1 hypothetical protein F5972_32790 [Microbispora cellulosiformans]